MSLSAGTKLGHHTIVSAIGKGGMGEVWKAEDTKLGRAVAIKTLPEEFAVDVDRLARFEREARLLAALNHPNIVTIHSVEEDDGIHYLTMELVDGQPLADILTDQGLEPARLIEIAIPITEALAAAHAKGITHRDLKPQNIMIAREGHIKVLDFGLAKYAETGGAGLGSMSQMTTATPTSAGAVLGTAPYMSPEQVEGREVDSRSDIFSIGILLYEMATGRRPFLGETSMSVYSSILRDEPRRLSDIKPGFPEGLSTIIRRCLAKNPDKRYTRAGDLLEALRSLSGDDAAAGPSGFIPLESVDTRVNHRTPLSARDDELSQLVRHLGRASDGNGGLITLVGEPGVGKTRLTQELLERAQARGTVTLVGHCYEGEGAPPYSPWIEILERTAHIANRDTLRSFLGDGAPEVAKLLPELRQIFPDLSPPLDLPPEQSRPYLFRCFREFIERAARLQPIVVILEDLHWADEATLLLLEHLAPHLAGLPLMIVGTYRDVELEVSRPLAKSLRQLVRERLLEKIALRRLPEVGVATMLSGLAGRDVPPTLVARIHKDTEGNPFFVEEVFLHLEEEGRLFDDKGDWRTDLSAEALDVPEGVRLVIGRRLERLSDENRAGLTAAAVSGRYFDFDLLAAVSRIDPDALLDAVEEAEHLGLIEPVSSGRRARYGFCHELIRHTLLAALSLPRRQRLHLRVADAIEETASDPSKSASALAHHLYQAGAAADEEKTLRYLNMAGEQALDSGAFEEALQNFDDALSLLEGEDAGKGADLLRNRGLALQSLGRWDDAIQDWQDALPLFEKRNDVEAIVDIATDAIYLLVWQGRPAEAVPIGRRALEQQVESDSGKRALLLARCGTATSMTGDYRTALELIAESEALAETLADPHLLGSILTNRVLHHFNFMEGTARTEASLRGADLLHTVGDTWNYVDVMGVRLFSSTQIGQIDLVDTYGDEIAATAERIGNFGALAPVYSGQVARGWLLTGHLDVAEDGLLERINDIFSRTKSPWLHPNDSWLTFGIFCRGQWEEALTSGREAVSNDAQLTVFNGLIWNFVFRYECYLGNRDAAHTLMRNAWDRIPKDDGPAEIGAWHMMFGLIEGLVMIGEPEKPAQLYPAAIAALATGTVTSIYGDRLLETVAGIAAAAGKRWEQAELHFETSMRQAHEIPSKFEQPEVRRFYAGMLIERNAPGDRDKARTLIDEAIAGYRELEMPRHVELVETTLRKQLEETTK